MTRAIIAALSIIALVGCMALQSHPPLKHPGRCRVVQGAYYSGHDVIGDPKTCYMARPSRPN